jgi:Large polyvalent protein-associated domain 7
MDANGDSSNNQQAAGGSEKRALNQISLPKNDVKTSDVKKFPAKLLDHLDKDGNAYRSKQFPDKIELVDRGDRMHAYRPVSQFIARGMAEIASERDWKSVNVSGDLRFQSRMFVELTDRGIQVQEYKPTSKDLEVVQRRIDGRTALQDPRVQAFNTADTPKAQKAAATQYPELKQAFAHLAAVQKFASQSLTDDKTREKFVGQFKANIGVAVHKGIPLPEIKLREPQQQQRQQQSESER